MSLSPLVTTGLATIIEGTILSPSAKILPGRENLSYKIISSRGNQNLNIISSIFGISPYLCYTEPKGKILNPGGGRNAGGKTAHARGH